MTSEGVWGVEAAGGRSKGGGGGSWCALADEQIVQKASEAPIATSFSSGPQTQSLVKKTPPLSRSLSLSLTLLSIY